MVDRGDKKVGLFLAAVCIGSIMLGFGSCRTGAFGDEPWIAPSDCEIVTTSLDDVWVLLLCRSPRAAGAEFTTGTWVHRIHDGDSTLLSKSDDWSYAAWSPDGKMLVLAYPGKEILLFRSDAWESGVQIHQGGSLRHGRPIWSPDSQSMAIAHLELGATLTLLKPDGTLDSLLGEFGDKWHINLPFGPTWSPDGRHLAFLVAPDSADLRRRELWSMNVDTREQQLLLSHDGPLSEPIWSPDGQRIALGGENLYSFDLEDKELQEVDTPCVSEPSSPLWAPDSKSLAIWSNEGLCAVSEVGETSRLLTERSGRVLHWTESGDGIVAKFGTEEGRETIELIHLK